MLKAVEGRGACKRTRPSEAVSRQIDSSEISTAPQIVQRLSRRLGCGVEVAAVVVELARLGPQEVTR